MCYKENSYFIRLQAWQYNSSWELYKSILDVNMIILFMFNLLLEYISFFYKCLPNTILSEECVLFLIVIKTNFNWTFINLSTASFDPNIFCCQGKSVKKGLMQHLWKTLVLRHSYINSFLYNILESFYEIYLRIFRL